LRKRARNCLSSSLDSIAIAIAGLPTEVGRVLYTLRGYLPKATGAEVSLKRSILSRALDNAALGPLAQLIIFVLLAHGHLELPGTFKGTGSLWTLSILVSTVSFWLYVAENKKSLSRAQCHVLLGKSGNRKSGV